MQGFESDIPLFLSDITIQIGKINYYNQNTGRHLRESNLNIYGVIITQRNEAISSLYILIIVSLNQLGLSPRCSPVVS
jgi:hypothetical protein